MKTKPRRVMVRPLVALVRFYQKMVSPTLGRNCRFAPTCSAYAVESLERFGVVRGTLLALRRLGRCHPFVNGGYDPVPERID